MTLRYDGTRYLGWQRQPAVPTIQAEVESAVLAVTGEATPVHGSGRTDAGVHALGQVAHFETSSRLDPATLARALNANLPDDVVVCGASEETPGFHARKSALRKTYVYQFLISRERHPLLRRTTLHLRDWPDVARMREAARLLIGRHDFRAFATRSHGVEDAVRHLQALRVLPARRILRVFATADGFLQHMVRSLAGLLLRVGTGRAEPSHAAEVLRSADRRLAPAALPARALFLWRVDYPARDALARSAGRCAALRGPSPDD